MTGLAGWLERLEETRTARRLASAVGVLLVVAAFGMMVSRASELGFFDRQPFWVADAIPCFCTDVARTTSSVASSSWSPCSRATCRSTGMTPRSAAPSVAGSPLQFARR